MDSFQTRCMKLPLNRILASLLVVSTFSVHTVPVLYTIRATILDRHVIRDYYHGKMISSQSVIPLAITN